MRNPGCIRHTLAASLAAALLAGCAGMAGDQAGQRQASSASLMQAIKEHGAGMSCCKEGMCKPGSDGKDKQCGCCAKHAMASTPGKPHEHNMGAGMQCMDQMNKAPKQSAG